MKMISDHNQSYLEKTSGALNVEQDVREGPHGISVPSHHHVCKADVIVHGDLTTGHTRVQALLVQLDVLQNFDGLKDKNCFIR